MTPQRVLAALLVLSLLGSLPAQSHPSTNSSRSVAITFDDLPFASGSAKPLTPADAKPALLINRKILGALASRHVPATGFVIGRFAEELGVAAGNNMLKLWLKPGFDLGNHLYSHPDVNTLSIEQVQQEITRGEASFAPLLRTASRNPRFLRFPFNHTGDTQQKHDAIASFMSAHGYRLAPCTIDTTDYEFNAAYVLAFAQHDKPGAARIRDAYLAYSAAEIDWYSYLSKQVLGYEPPQIMLLHDNQLNADTISDLLSLFEQRGYRFISLSEALSDKAYQIPETYITKFGPMWGYRWAKELNVKVNGKDEPEPPAWIAQYGVQHPATPHRNK